MKPDIFYMNIENFIRLSIVAKEAQLGRKLDLQEEALIRVNAHASLEASLAEAGYVPVKLFFN